MEDWCDECGYPSDNIMGGCMCVEGNGLSPEEAIEFSKWVADKEEEC